MGKTEINFKLLEKPKGQDLWLDYRGIKIGRYFLNGVDILARKEKTFENHHIALPSDSLKVGEMN